MGCVYGKGRGYWQRWVIVKKKGGGGERGGNPLKTKNIPHPGLQLGFESGGELRGEHFFVGSDGESEHAGLSVGF